MKKIIFALLLSLGLAQVAPVEAKGSKAAAWIKEHKVALAIGTAAVVAGVAMVGYGVYSADAGTHAGKPTRAQKWKANDDGSALVEDDAAVELGSMDAGVMQDGEIKAGSLGKEAGKWTYVPGSPVVNTGVAKLINKIETGALTMFNPKGKGYMFGGLTIAADAILVAALIDCGYNLITNKPELARALYNLATGKKAKLPVAPVVAK